MWLLKYRVDGEIKLRSSNFFAYVAATYRTVLPIRYISQRMSVS